MIDDCFGLIAEPDNQVRLEPCGQALQGRNARRVLTALDPGDDGVARPDALRELLLSQTQRLAPADHDPGDPLVGGKSRELLAVGDAASR